MSTNGHPTFYFNSINLVIDYNDCYCKSKDSSVGFLSSKIVDKDSISIRFYSYSFLHKSNSPYI